MVKSADLALQKDLGMWSQMLKEKYRMRQKQERLMKGVTHEKSQRTKSKLNFK